MIWAPWVVALAGPIRSISKTTFLNNSSWFFFIMLNFFVLKVKVAKKKIQKLHRGEFFFFHHQWHLNPVTGNAILSSKWVSDSKRSWGGSVWTKGCFHLSSTKLGHYIDWSLFLCQLSTNTYKINLHTLEDSSMLHHVSSSERLGPKNQVISSALLFNTAETKRV